MKLLAMLLMLTMMSACSEMPEDPIIERNHQERTQDLYCEGCL